MRGYPYDPSPEWDWFPQPKLPAETEVGAGKKRRENAPDIVLGEVGVVLSFALAAALMINLALTLFHLG